MKILNSIWFHSMGNPMIGIVLGQDEVTEKYKAYIGVITSSSSEEVDCKTIALSGAKFPVDVAKMLMEGVQC